MDNIKQRKLLQEFINEPKHKGLTEEQRNNSFKSSVAACEDIFFIHLEIENNFVKQAKFSGAGCAVSAGSVEATLRIIEGKTKEQVTTILDKFEKLIDGEIKTTGVEELDVFSIVQSHVSRKKCARAPIEAIRKAIR